MIKIILISAVSFFFLCVLPFRDTVTIKKESIIGNYPFAGQMVFKERPDLKVYVTTDVSCDYWMERDAQPDVQTLKVERWGLIGLMFNIGSTY